MSQNRTLVLRNSTGESILGLERTAVARMLFNVSESGHLTVDLDGGHLQLNGPITGVGATGLTAGHVLRVTSSSAFSFGALALSDTTGSLTYARLPSGTGTWDATPTVTGSVTAPSFIGSGFDLTDLPLFAALDTQVADGLDELRDELWRVSEGYGSARKLLYAALPSGSGTWTGNPTVSGTLTVTGTPFTLSAASAVIALTSTTGVKQITTGAGTDLWLNPGSLVRFGAFSSYADGVGYITIKDNADTQRKLLVGAPSQFARMADLGFAVDAINLDLWEVSEGVGSSRRLLGEKLKNAPANVPLTTPDVQDVIDALLELGLVEQSD